MKYYKCINIVPYLLSGKQIDKNIIYKETYNIAGFISSNIKHYVNHFPKDWLEVSKENYLKSKVKELKDMFYDKSIVFEVNLDQNYVNIFYKIINILFVNRGYQNIDSHISIWSDITKIIYYNSITNENYFKAFTTKNHTDRYQNIKYINFKDLIDEIKEINNE